MATDGELNVFLKPANNLEDEIDEPTVNANMEQNRGGAAGQRQEQGGGMIAGVGRKGIVIGILAAILSQMRSIQETAGGLLRTFSKMIAPLLAGFVETIRPFIEMVSENLANFDLANAVANLGRNLVNNLRNVFNSLLSALGVKKRVGGGSGGPSSVQDVAANNPRSTVGIPTQEAQLTEGTAATRSEGFAPFMADAIDKINPKTADRHDEERKEVTAETTSDMFTMKTGGSPP